MDAQYNARLKKAIGRTLRQITAFQLSQYMSSKKPQIIEVSDYKAGQVLANEMILITVSGDSLKMLFKLHFNHTQAKSRLAHQDTLSNHSSQSSMQNNHEEESPSLCYRDIDFMKELSNQICGCFSRKLAGLNIELGLSIPLCTKGYYEIYAEYENIGNMFIRFNDCWQLQDLLGELYCSYTLEITDQTIVHPLIAITPDLPSSHGQIEFL